ncbi:MAG: hypothetical protein H5T69_06305 [Chloroflexi bacterium]|nr:hypothetical protein [Chloroflexota bacterium]
MIAYLSYRLRLLEAEIESMEQLLGHKSDIAGDQNASWSWDQRRRHERRWASLTHLNYLRTARDTLRRALYML